MHGKQEAFVDSKQLMCLPGEANVIFAYINENVISRTREMKLHSVWQDHRWEIRYTLESPFQEGCSLTSTLRKGTVSYKEGLRDRGILIYKRGCLMGNKAVVCMI